MNDTLVDTTQTASSSPDPVQTDLPALEGSTAAGVNLLLTLGIMHWRKGDHDKANEALRSALEIAVKIQDKRLDAVCFNAIALVKTDLGMFDEAVEAYEQAVELAPDKIFIWGHLGNLYTELGRYEEAIEALLKILDYHPEEAVHWNTLAHAYTSMGQMDMAITACQRAIDLNDTYVEAWMSLGGLYEKQNLNGDAIQMYQKVTAIDPKNALAWNELGSLYFELEAFDEALDAYNRAIELGLESGWAYCNLASAYAARGEFAAAIPLYQKSIELLDGQGDKAVAWNRLGDVYRQVKEYDNAIAAYQMADRSGDGRDGASTHPDRDFDHILDGQQIADALSSEVLEQVREIVAAENASAAAGEPQAEPQAEPQSVPVAEAEQPALDTFQPINLEQAPVAAEEPQVEEVLAAEETNAPAQEDASPAPVSEIADPVAEPEIAENAEPAVPISEVPEDVTEQDLAGAPEAQADEIDLKSAHIWNELGNIHFKVGAFDEALEAYNTALELGLELGWLYSNLGFACAYKGKYAEAIPLYEKSIALLGDDKDKAISWGRMAEAYRKLGEDDKVVMAYEKARELDLENLSYSEILGEIAQGLQVDEQATAVNESAEAPESPEASSVAEPVEASAEAGQTDAEAAATPESVEAVSTETVQAEVAPVIVDEPEAPVEVQPIAETETVALAEASSEPMAMDQVEAAPVSAVEPEPESLAQIEEIAPAAEENDDDVDASAVPDDDEDADESFVAKIISRLFGEDETVPELVVEKADLPEQQAPAVEAPESPVEIPAAQPELFVETQATESADAVEQAVAPVNETLAAPAEDLAAPVDAPVEQPTQAESVEAVEPAVEPAPEQVAEPTLESTPAAAVDNMDATATADYMPAGEIDLKSAYVWNELGNVFSKANALTDAIDAYNKAIELDPQYGWAYSNLGLVFTRVGKSGEAIPLYQKSIELLGDARDKAVSWNRLGDAYRQINEYDNAIAAYQIADELNQASAAQISSEELRIKATPTPVFSYQYGGTNDRL